MRGELQTKVLVSVISIPHTVKEIADQIKEPTSRVASCVNNLVVQGKLTAAGKCGKLTKYRQTTNDERLEQEAKRNALKFEKTLAIKLREMSRQLHETARNFSEIASSLEAEATGKDQIIARQDAEIRMLRKSLATLSQANQG